MKMTELNTKYKYKIKTYNAPYVTIELFVGAPAVDTWAVIHTNVSTTERMLEGLTVRDSCSQTKSSTDNMRF